MTDHASSRISLQAGGRSFACRMTPAGPDAIGWIFAIHGGGQNSKYFDMGAASAMSFLAQRGYHVVACDRPGYGANRDWILGFDEQVPVLAELIEAAKEYLRAENLPPPFLYGHSIGGMLSILLANMFPDRYLGVATTGSGPVYREGPGVASVRSRVASAGVATHAPAPAPGGPAKYVSPEGTFDPELAGFDAERDEGSLIVDLRDALDWQARMPIEAHKLSVPIHFVMPEHDQLWNPNAVACADLAKWFALSPLVEVHIQRFSGHSVLVHRVATAHLLRILAFIRECVISRGLAKSQDEK